MGSFINRNRHPEPGHAGQRNRGADLRCKASFDRLEQRPAFPNVAVRPRERQRNERHESDAADPVGDEHDMQMRGLLRRRRSLGSLAPKGVVTASPAWRYAAFASDEPALCIALRYRSSSDSCSSRSSLSCSASVESGMQPSA